MKTSLALALTFLTGVITLPRVAEAGSATEIKAPIQLAGNLYNGRLKQSLSTKVAGKGEYGPLNLDVNLDGTMRTRDSGRPLRGNVLGEYPVEIRLRVSRSGLSVKDTFTTTVKVRRRAIEFGEYGRVALNRPVRPTAKGRQVIRGRGTLRYKF